MESHPPPQCTAAAVATKQRVREEHGPPPPTTRKRQKTCDGTTAKESKGGPTKVKRDWNGKFVLLCAFQCEHGHCRVPPKFVVESVKLGIWVRNQRYFYNNALQGKKVAGGTITSERIAQLNSIGFEWNVLLDKNNDHRPPRTSGTVPPPFHAAASCQRNTTTARATTEHEHPSRPNQEDFAAHTKQPPKTSDATTLKQKTDINHEWKRKMDLLCTFKGENGHCRVPKSYVVDSVQLGEWVKRQRRCYKDSTSKKKGKGRSITAERIAQLNAIGFEWTVDKADDWQQKFELLQAFQREHGHCRVSQMLVVDAVNLGSWVSQQRYLYNCYADGKIKGVGALLTEDRIDQLNSLGFEWKFDKDKVWQQKFDLLCDFQRKTGHCQVPQNMVVDSVRLGEWVSCQRVSYKNYSEGKTGHSITEEHIRQLNTIGFGWKLFDSRWQNKFELLRAYHAEHGHCRVPKNFVVGSARLGDWVSHQKRLHQYAKKGIGASLTEARMAQLDAIGFEWLQKERRRTTTATRGNK